MVISLKADLCIFIPVLAKVIFSQTSYLHELAQSRLAESNTGQLMYRQTRKNKHHWFKIQHFVMASFKIIASCSGHPLPL